MLNLKSLQLNKLILIGASTGGPRDIKTIIKAIPEDFNASIVIAQHMGDEFISSFTSHMNVTTYLDVKVAHNNESLQSKTIYVATNCCRIKQQSNELVFHISDKTHNSYNPNINELFKSCSKFSNNIDTLACILTGIGDDGAKGMLELVNHNTKCISANKASSAVYGMPLRAQEVSSKVQSLSLSEISNKINQFGAQ